MKLIKKIGRENFWHFVLMLLFVFVTYVVTTISSDIGTAFVLGIAALIAREVVGYVKNKNISLNRVFAMTLAIMLGVFLLMIF